MTTTNHSLTTIAKNISSQLGCLHEHLELLSTPQKIAESSDLNQSRESVIKSPPKTPGALFQYPSNSGMPSVQKYIRWIVEAGEIDLEVLIIAYILVERVLEKRDPFSPVNLYKLFCTSVFVAQKLQHDLEIWAIDDFADLVNVTETELKMLEIEFLSFLNFSVHVNRKEFEICCNKLSPKKKTGIFEN